MGNKPSYFNNATYYAARPVETVSYYDIRENPNNTDDPAVDWPANSAVNATSFMGVNGLEKLPRNGRRKFPTLVALKSPRFSGLENSPPLQGKRLNG
jgi:hypothetical protein